MLNGFHFSYNIIIFCHPSKLAFESCRVEWNFSIIKLNIAYRILLLRCCVFVDAPSKKLNSSSRRTNRHLNKFVIIVIINK